MPKAFESVILSGHDNEKKGVEMHKLCVWHDWHHLGMVLMDFGPVLSACRWVRSNLGSHSAAFKNIRPLRFANLQYESPLNYSERKGKYDDEGKDFYWRQSILM